MASLTFHHQMKAAKQLCQRQVAVPATPATGRSLRPALATPSQIASPSTSSSSSASNRQLTASRQFSGRLQVVAAATVQSSAPTSSGVSDDLDVSKAATSIIQYAINLARVSETYEVHSWMLLLGLLKHETSTGAKILQDLGLTDLYGAWHEVLWALHSCDGLESRAYTPEICFATRAFRIMRGASNFAQWAGRSKVQSEDILMALAAANVLNGLFPDLSLTFAHVRKAAAKRGCRYNLPDDTKEDGKIGGSVDDDNIF
mmetsp:Transcript_5422/g.11984  ORF Transcript_5422/g.11984 Transcript_5422/m.11984 type:complete len:259 (+) Transcript_5422:36-812(+)|eukprot:CAMPEP_0202901286 /NCGR_PEP_ID=MMETSP1392-20130828/14170_1 /ASSEMBLY_ACC=CAM_ASM_000868 /TAXON_ID=225041 /ORGANISM="Chlamydomonas chlamydogama, Strain SAG 11-48b" /LENGTH=258 /DNA_ID=CAMNT_0049587831 /DNA_START=13 /DNA_END=789 /DNA_ORIENTATION=+